MSEITQRFAMKALIVNGKNQVLVLREAPTYSEGANHGHYHLPGGRVEAGEEHDRALRREVKEETSLNIEIKYPVYVGEWRPVIRGKKYQIIGVFVVCMPSNTEIKLSIEHDNYKWIDPKANKKLNILHPDIDAINRFGEWTDRNSG